MEETRRRVSAILAAFGLVLNGCGQPPEQLGVPQPSVTAPPSAATPGPLPPSPRVEDDLLASFTAMAEEVPAAVGVTVSDAATTRSFGSEFSGPAWSTIKAPLAIAAFQMSGDSAETSAAPAIGQSDNAAAEELWSMLGGGSTAAAAVDAVLREGGDMATVVQSERVRAGFTPFGQTEWTTDAQARFAARLPCIPGAERVVALMRQLVSDQQWGLARGEAVAAKGGWGPGVDGMYLVRQIALIGDANGALGVALIARPDDGTFESGVAAIDQLASWVAANEVSFTFASC